MTSNTGQRAHELFMELFELPDGERAAALARLPGAALRAEVESLLNSHDQAGPFLASPTAQGAGQDAAPGGPSEAATMAAPIREGPGTRIGPYKLLQLIGEGGFGSVFMAEQEKPVSRRVALKIIKLGMDTRAVIARFEAERQALALMDHANIARVLDAGATETGRPFFVMELCKGEAIVEYCDKNNLSIEDRLELFAQVCAAVQHAHTKGIIHRDIKPSNVLVSTQDGRPHAKVIDFGIAKATASKLTEKTLFTEHRQLIGTPEYMSPEQAEGSLDIDTRTDVYSLGVLLYELLTGTTPFSGSALRSAAYAEIQRIIREVEPPKPSTRLSHNTDTLASVAARRHTEPKKLGTIIRGDLDWIVMKALEKDRQRRYETANGLALDIQRHLGGEAVLAAPPSTAYRMRKFVRRNRPQVAAAALATVALLLGLAGTAWQAKVASDRAAAARKAEGEARTARDDEKTRADELKQVSDFQKKMLAQVDPSTAGVRLTEDVTRRFAAALEKAKVPEAERGIQADAFRHNWSRVNATDAAKALIDETILKPAVKAIDEQFHDQPVVDAQLRATLAQRYFALGLYDAAVPLLDSALKTRRRVLRDDDPDTLESINNMGNLLLAQGKAAEAEPYYREAFERFRLLGEDAEGTLVSMSNLANLLPAPEAEPLMTAVLEKSRRVRGEKAPYTILCICNLGAFFQSQGKYAKAEELFREAVGKSRNFNTLNELGHFLAKQGRLAEAEPYVKEAVEMTRRELGEEHPDTLIAISNMGGLLETQGKLAQAEAYFKEVLEKRRRVLPDDHGELMWGLYNVGYVLLKEGKAAEAEPYFRELLEKRRRLQGEEDPDTLQAVAKMVSVLSAQSRFDEAEAFNHDLIEQYRRAPGKQDPQVLASVNGLGKALLSEGKCVEAEQVFAEGVAACERAFTDAHPLAALLLHHHADALRKLGRPDDAAPGARRAVDMYGAHPEWDPTEAAHAAAILGSILLAQGHKDESLTFMREAFSLARRTVRPGTADFAGTNAGFGLALLQHGTLEDAREAEPLLRESLETRIKVMPESWLVPNSRSLLGAAIVTIADLDTALKPEARAGRLREAEPLLLDGYAGLKDNPAVPPPEKNDGFDRRREALERLVRLYEVWDKAEPGKGYHAKGAEWSAKLGAAGIVTEPETKP